MNNRKLGKFSISLDLLDEGPSEDLMKLMGRVFIVRAETLFAQNCIEYVGVSEYFKEIPTGRIVPEYKFIFDEGQILCHEKE